MSYRSHSSAARYVLIIISTPPYLHPNRSNRIRPCLYTSLTWAAGRSREAQNLYSLRFCFKTPGQWSDPRLSRATSARTRITHDGSQQLSINQVEMEIPTAISVSRVECCNYTATANSAPLSRICSSSSCTWTTNTSYSETSALQIHPRSLRRYA